MPKVKMSLRRFIGLLGVCSLGAGLFMLHAGKDWETSLMWISLGVLLLMEYKDQKIKEPH